MDRIPFSRRISRHFEGTENKAGIFSDLAAIITELARRNPQVIKEQLHTFGEQVKEAQQQRAQEKAQQPQGVTPNATE